MLKTLLSTKTLKAIILLVILTFSTIAHAETYTVTLDSSTSGSNNVHWTTSNTSFTYNNVTWETKVNGKDPVYMQSVGTTYAKIGTSSAPAKSVTISTNSFVGKRITAVSLTGYCTSNTGPKLTITAGITTILSNCSLIKDTSTEYEVNNLSIDLSGNDKLTFSISSSADAAIIISEIKVTYEGLEDPTFSLSATAMELEINEMGSLTLTTNSDGAVTFSCTNPNLIISHEDKIATFYAAEAGIYTITVAVAATSTYSRVESQVVVTVTKKPTTITIDDANLTNTDYYISNNAGYLTCVIRNGDNIILNPDITWHSSDTGVATVDSEGYITLVASGTTTITATYIGSTEYAESSTDYVLTVTDSTPYEQPLEVSINLNTTLFSVSDKQGTASEAESYQATQDRINVSYDVPKGSYRYMNSYKVSLYYGITLTLEAPTGYSIKGVAFTKGDKWEGVSVNTGTLNAQSWSGSTSSLVISATSASDFTRAVITLANTPSVGSTGYATFSSTNPLDFTSISNIKAYIATPDGTTGVNFTRVYKVPANTGLLLVSANGGAVAATAVPYLTGEADYVTGNVFVAVNEDTNVSTTADGKNNYILNVGSHGIGFYQAAGNKVGAGKAYISVPTSTQVKGFITLPDYDETTGICEMVNNKSVNGQCYNLAGHRVNGVQKGVFIVNGKKVIK